MGIGNGIAHKETAAEIQKIRARRLKSYGYNSNKYKKGGDGDETPAEPATVTIQLKIGATPIRQNIVWNYRD